MPASPRSDGVRAANARLRLEIRAAMATGEALIEAIRMSVEQYDLTKGETDVR